MIPDIICMRRKHVHHPNNSPPTFERHVPQRSGRLLAQTHWDELRVSLTHRSRAVLRAVSPAPLHGKAWFQVGRVSGDQATKYKESPGREPPVIGSAMCGCWGGLELGGRNPLEIGSDASQDERYVGGREGQSSVRPTWCRHQSFPSHVGWRKRYILGTAPPDRLGRAAWKRKKNIAAFRTWDRRLPRFAQRETALNRCDAGALSDDPEGANLVFPFHHR